MQYAAFTLSFIVDTLEAKGLLTADVVKSVKTFIAENQTTAPVAGISSHPYLLYLAITLLHQAALPELCSSIASCGGKLSACLCEYQTIHGACVGILILIPTFVSPAPQPSEFILS